jgi:hypothetical protein
LQKRESYRLRNAANKKGNRIKMKDSLTAVLVMFTAAYFWLPNHFMGLNLGMILLLDSSAIC